MKLNGFVGTGTGKLGASVFSINAGNQIVRQYQPSVANPSTTEQVEQRAKFKLMSQLSAAMRIVIAIAKDGMKSARNQFVSENIGLVSVTDGVANVDAPNLQLTKSNIGMLPFTANWSSSGSMLSWALSGAMPANFLNIVYLVFAIGADKKLTLVHEQVSTDGSGFVSGLPQSDVIVYGYGVTASSEEGATKYAEYEVASATQIASLISTRKLLSSEVKTTKTLGVYAAYPTSNP